MHCIALAGGGGCIKGATLFRSITTFLILGWMTGHVILSPPLPILRCTELYSPPPPDPVSMHRSGTVRTPMTLRPCLVLRTCSSGTHQGAAQAGGSHADAWAFSLSSGRWREHHTTLCTATCPASFSECIVTLQCSASDVRL